MFSGIYFSEELYALTLSGMEEHTALRVEPLDERCQGTVSEISSSNKL